MIQLFPISRRQSALPEIASALPRETLESEIRQFHQLGRCLAQQGAFSVFVGTAPEMPCLLQEIGRQREIAFRAVAESTGAALDLDRFDAHYLHLFLWDSNNQAVVGAYRLGQANLILRKHGPRGLYTSTLFRFKKTFLNSLDDALELGRSFVAPQFQRNSVAMPLLWKGISLWLAQNPDYRRLFGPVSISQDYGLRSRRLMVRFLRKKHSDPELSRLVWPRKPFFALGVSSAERAFIESCKTDAEACSDRVAGMEPDGKGMPVLLKHYLKLNGKFLSFNRVPDFSSVLDGLVVVDMLQADPRLPSRLMGREKWSGYLSHHRKSLACLE